MVSIRNHPGVMLWPVLQDGVVPLLTVHPHRWVDPADAAVEDAFDICVVDELAEDSVRVLEVAVAVLLEAGTNGWSGEEEGQDGGGEGVDEVHLWEVLDWCDVVWSCADVTYSFWFWLIKV